MKAPGTKRLALLTASILWVTFCGCIFTDGPVKAPARLPYINVALPHSTRNYYHYETGFQHTMLQVRFEIDPRDLPTLASRLPCRLGPVDTAPSEFATVGSNDRDWYVPESARRHRGCEYQHGIKHASFLVDVADPARATVYAVVTLE